MLETRGPSNIVVSSGHAIKAQEIAESIFMYRSVAWMCERYPITEAEIFEVVDYYADGEMYVSDDPIVIKNYGTDTDLDLETTQVSDTMFFKLIQYGRMFYPHEDRFEYLYADGLATIITEIYTDLDAGLDHFYASDVHDAVYNTLKVALKGLTPKQVLESMEHHHRTKQNKRLQHEQENK